MKISTFMDPVANKLTTSEFFYRLRKEFNTTSPIQIFFHNCIKKNYIYTEIKSCIYSTIVFPLRLFSRKAEDKIVEAVVERAFGNGLLRNSIHLGLGKIVDDILDRVRRVYASVSGVIWRILKICGLVWMEKGMKAVAKSALRPLVNRICHYSTKTVVDRSIDFSSIVGMHGLVIYEMNKHLFANSYLTAVVGGSYLLFISYKASHKTTSIKKAVKTLHHAEDLILVAEKSLKKMGLRFFSPSLLQNLIKVVVEEAVR